MVNPEPESAERAWKRATSGDMPVRVRATVATRVAVSDATTTRKNVTRAIIERDLGDSTDSTRHDSRSDERPGLDAEHQWRLMMSDG
ncbi:MAG: hypothetical protein AAF945_09035 [Actinomycetota bacterium]